MKSIADKYMTMLIESLSLSILDDEAESTFHNLIELLYLEKENVLNRLKKSYIDNAALVLVSDDIEGDVQKIVEASASQPFIQIDYIDGIFVRGNFECSFSAVSFLSYIGYK